MAPIPPQIHVAPQRLRELQGARPPLRPVVILMTLFLFMMAPSSSAIAADWVAAGFQLDQLVSLGGAGPDPGPGNSEARLDWAVQVAVPIEWRNAVSVRWEIGNAGRGHLALSYLNGVVVVSQRVLAASSEALLATIAHEMGHHVAFQLVSPGDGSPPGGFAEIRGPGYRDIREAWADCVSRVWTGSLHRTISEPEPCPLEAAQWVAGQLSTPGVLGGPAIGARAIRPRAIPPPPVVPPPPVAPPSPVPTPAAPKPPAVQPRVQMPRELPEPADDGPPMGALAAIMILIPAAAGFAGNYVIKRRFAGGYAEASAPRMQGSPAPSPGDRVRKVVSSIRSRVSSIRSRVSRSGK